MQNLFPGFTLAQETQGYLGTNKATPGFDMFNRQLVVTPTTTFVTHPAYTMQKGRMDFVSTGTGVVTYDISNCTIVLSASGSGGKAVRQSREYQLYQPGKLQNFYMSMTPQYTGTFDDSVAIRLGNFDDYRDKNSSGSTNPGTGVEVNQKSMGHFFELSGAKWFVVERANSPDNLSNITRIPQSSWNLDTLDGNRTSSPSGFILPSPITQAILIVIQRQWLGVGSVRMGFVINGRTIFCHMFHQRNLSGPYTRLPNLPLRWEIEKVAGGSSSSASFGSICASSQMMGDYVPFGRLVALPSEIVATARTVDTTMRPLLIVRLRQQFCRASFRVKEFDFYNSSGTQASPAPVGFTVYRNPTISGSPAYTFTSHPDSNSMTEYKWFGGASSNAYTISGGETFYSGFVDNRSLAADGMTVPDLITARAFTSDIKGNVDTLVFAAYAFSGSVNLRVVAKWLEIT